MQGAFMRAFSHNTRLRSSQRVYLWKLHMGASGGLPCFSPFFSLVLFQSNVHFLMFLTTYVFTSCLLSITGFAFLFFVWNIHTYIHTCIYAYTCMYAYMHIHSHRLSHYRPKLNPLTNHIKHNILLPTKSIQSLLLLTPPFSALALQIHHQCSYINRPFHLHFTFHKLIRTWKR